ncbi:3-oxoacyl-[acyl-carrier-protein] synthase 3 [Pirellulimonas nuda]|uniref:3-oxoacyl-[acyl-carrier-protein] synthase 3 n=1 Tax=Pirellulimonas nuda TaxID=2528009 RepID=A0A518DIC4_9BACT|nr:3-oxoacyl-[acyl-carrier-protein] synthase III C-terminal domain-containing protein [Pirellulimonas nuda]QDU91224.1 3-oxoacyl-[acyl-carrier-protein] synthase 3 [Pirellulimonas nuda]
MSVVTQSIFESIGVALPERRVATRDIVAGCVNSVRLPLERLTGIRERRLAGDGLYSIDLAEAAARDCLTRGALAPEQVDLVVCTNISRCDSEKTISYEPATSIKLKQRLGLGRALAIDVSNACAGMWTGVYLADAMIRTGAARHALVVSGEYISYLIDSAQQEITDFMDPQIASLTLGDAGVAVALGRSPSPEVGLHALDLYTLGKYAPHCVAKPSSEAAGRPVMLTDAIKVTEAVVPHAARHAKLVLDRHGWTLDSIDCVVPHQTSQLTMQEGMKEIDRLYGHDLWARCVNNLPERGNTSSNSHFLAMFDATERKQVGSRNRVVFCISGSGQTTGTALYTLDDLPDRLHSAAGQTRSTAEEHKPAGTIGATLRLASVAVHRPGSPEEIDTVGMLAAAAEQCLAAGPVGLDDVELLLSTSTYRTDFVMEPAIAALVAGRLRMNDDRPAGHAKKTLAFDVMNGPVGFLKACFLAGELATAGKLTAAMVLASEVENGRILGADTVLGLEEMASAALLAESEAGDGFLAFEFYDDLSAIDEEGVQVSWGVGERPHIIGRRGEKLHDAYVRAIGVAVGRLLESQQLALDDIGVLLPPQVDAGFPARVAKELGFPLDRTVCCDATVNLATSSVPQSYRTAVDSGRAAPGDLGLMIAVGAGVQVGCAIYQF